MQSYISPSPLICKAYSAHLLFTPTQKIDAEEPAPFSTDQKLLSRLDFWSDDSAQELILRPGRKARRWGLRNLSKRVLYHVGRMGSARYGQVAQQLLLQLSQVQTTAEPKLKQGKETGKTEQNIKRRVYDALNVMTAAKVIYKEGPKILSTSKQQLECRRIAERLKELKMNISGKLLQLEVARRNSEQLKERQRNWQQEPVGRDRDSIAGDEDFNMLQDSSFSSVKKDQLVKEKLCVKEEINH